MNRHIPITQLQSCQHFTAGVLSTGWVATLGAVVKGIFFTTFCLES